MYIVLYIIFAFIILKTNPLIFTITAFAVLTYFKYFKSDVKDEYTSNKFIQKDNDIRNAITLLHQVNTYRTDVNQKVVDNIHKFLDLYTDIFIKWDKAKFDILFDIKNHVLRLILELEFERDDIQYNNTYQNFTYIFDKYILILSNKYNIDVDAPNPFENINHNMNMI